MSASREAKRAHAVLNSIMGRRSGPAGPRCGAPALLQRPQAEEGCTLLCCAAAPPCHSVHLSLCTSVLLPCAAAHKQLRTAR